MHNVIKFTLINQGANPKISKSDGYIYIFNHSCFISEHHNKTDKSLSKKCIYFSMIMLLYIRNHEKSLQSDFECDVVLAVSV